MENLTAHTSPHQAEQKMHLQKLNLSKLQKTDLSDVGSYYCSPSFFQT